MFVFVVKSVLHFYAYLSRLTSQKAQNIVKYVAMVEALCCQQVSLFLVGDLRSNLLHCSVT